VRAQEAGVDLMSLPARCCTIPGSRRSACYFEDVPSARYQLKPLPAESIDSIWPQTRVVIGPVFSETSGTPCHYVDDRSVGAIGLSVAEVDAD
jgi:hypothetical protein